MNLTSVIKKNILLFQIALFSLGCTEVKLKDIEKQESQAPPDWKTPTMTQTQCDAIFKTPGGWIVNDTNKGLYFICAVYNKLTEDLILAPEMKFFKESGAGISGAMGVHMFYGTENGIALGLGGIDLISKGLSYIESEMNKTQAKIKYRQISGSSDILSPIQSGFFYKIDTNNKEDTFEYQLQAENSYGVSPVKTIRITVKKSGIEPVSQPQCPGFSNTVFINLDEYLGGRLLSKHYGQFGPNAALVVKFSIATTGLIRISNIGNGWTFSDKSGNLSTRPCDFDTNKDTFYNHENYNDMPQFGSYHDYSNDLVNTQRTFYVNVKNLQTSSGCGPMGYSDCAQYVEYTRIRVSAAELGSTVYLRKDWGYADCLDGGGKSTRKLSWNSVTSAYEEVSCVQGQYIDPYYVK